MKKPRIMAKAATMIAHLTKTNFRVQMKAFCTKKSKRTKRPTPMAMAVATLRFTSIGSPLGLR